MDKNNKNLSKSNQQQNVGGTRWRLQSAPIECRISCSNSTATSFLKMHDATKVNYPPNYQRNETEYQGETFLKIDSPQLPLSPTLPEPTRLDLNVDASTITSVNILAELSSGSETLPDNWQSLKKCVRERNSAMFLNEVMSDVHFLVGSKASSEKPHRVPAHKYVLATSSSVFYAMFYGTLAEQKHEIEIPDVEPDAFVAMLRYLYCDQIHLEPGSVISILYCAKKYLLPHLSKICVKFLETNLTAQNACVLLSQSRLFDEKGLVQRCYEVIDAQAEMALSSDAFSQIDYDTLRFILSRDTLNAKEITIFKSTIKWASAECRRRCLSDITENQRLVLSDVLHLVRIPAMTLEEFANGPAQLNILTVNEINDIFLHFTAENKPKLTFPIEPRCGLRLLKCHRFLTSAYRSNQWRYRGRCDSIQFSVDRRIFVVGFGLYGSSNGAAEYKVKIELKREERSQSNTVDLSSCGSCASSTPVSRHTRFNSDGSSNTFLVFFDYPIQVEANTFYIASVILDGKELSFFGQDGVNDVLQDGINFHFQSSSESTNGTGVQGGQIPEILFYAPGT